MQFDQLPLSRQNSPPRERINVKQRYKFYSSSLVYTLLCHLPFVPRIRIAPSFFFIPFFVPRCVPRQFYGLIPYEKLVTRSKQEITNRCANVANSIGEKVSVELGHASHSFDSANRNHSERKCFSALWIRSRRSIKSLDNSVHPFSLSHLWSWRSYEIIKPLITQGFWWSNYGYSWWRNVKILDKLRISLII